MAEVFTYSHPHRFEFGPHSGHSLLLPSLGPLPSPAPPGLGLGLDSIYERDMSSLPSHFLAPPSIGADRATRLAYSPRKRSSSPSSSSSYHQRKRSRSRTLTPCSSPPIMGSSRVGGYDQQQQSIPSSLQSFYMPSTPAVSYMTSPPQLMSNTAQSAGLYQPTPKHRGLASHGVLGSFQSTSATFQPSPLSFEIFPTQYHGLPSITEGTRVPSSLAYQQDLMGSSAAMPTFSTLQLSSHAPRASDKVYEVFNNYYLVTTILSYALPDDTTTTKKDKTSTDGLKADRFYLADWYLTLIRWKRISRRFEHAMDGCLKQMSDEIKLCGVMKAEAFKQHSHGKTSAVPSRNKRGEKEPQGPGNFACYHCFVVKGPEHFENFKWGNSEKDRVTEIDGSGAGGAGGGDEDDFAHSRASQHDRRGMGNAPRQREIALSSAGMGFQPSSPPRQRQPSLSTMSSTTVYDQPSGSPSMNFLGRDNSVSSALDFGSPPPRTERAVPGGFLPMIRGPTDDPSTSINDSYPNTTRHHQHDDPTTSMPINSTSSTPFFLPAPQSSAPSLEPIRLAPDAVEMPPLAEHDTVSRRVIETWGVRQFCIHCGIKHGYYRPGDLIELKVPMPHDSRKMSIWMCRCYRLHKTGPGGVMACPRCSQITPLSGPNLDRARRV